MCIHLHIKLMCITPLVEWFKSCSAVQRQNRYVFSPFQDSGYLIPCLFSCACSTGSNPVSVWVGEAVVEVLIALSLLQFGAYHFRIHVPALRLKPIWALHPAEYGMSMPAYRAIHFIPSHVNMALMLLPGETLAAGLAKEFCPAMPQELH